MLGKIIFLTVLPISESFQSMVYRCVISINIHLMQVTHKRRNIMAVFMITLIIKPDPNIGAVY